MKTQYTLIGLSAFGTLFAGYLSYGKFFTGSCTLNVGCSYFLGYPTCYYGFVMFLALFILSLGYARFQKSIQHKLIRIVALAGTIFSAYFSVLEITPMITTGVQYDLFFPSCTYGLIAYGLILWLTTPKKAE